MHGSHDQNCLCTGTKLDSQTSEIDYIPWTSPIWGWYVVLLIHRCIQFARILFSILSTNIHQGYLCVVSICLFGLVRLFLCVCFGPLPTFGMSGWCWLSFIKSVRNYFQTSFFLSFFLPPGSLLRLCGSTANGSWWPLFSFFFFFLLSFLVG